MDQEPFQKCRVNLRGACDSYFHSVDRPPGGEEEREGKLMRCRGEEVMRRLWYSCAGYGEYTEYTEYTKRIEHYQKMIVVYRVATGYSLLEYNLQRASGPTTLTIATITTTTTSPDLVFASARSLSPSLYLTCISPSDPFSSLTNRVAFVDTGLPRY